MAFAETKVLREDWEVGPRLKELQTDRDRLLRVRSVAIGAAADATPFHPANAAGTFSYQQGTFSLRNEHVGHTKYEPDRPNGVEAIKNPDIRVRIVFANVDVACSDLELPKARSEKGAGAERLCAGNGLFGSLPHFTKSTVDDEGWTTYYLMVAPNGAVELSRATVENGRFKEFFERLFLSDGSDLDLEVVPVQDSPAVEEFDPQIARK